MDLFDEADALVADPVAFIRSFNPEGNESRVVVWEWDRDGRREVMVPHGFFLMVIAPANFRAEIRTRNQGTVRTLEQNEALVAGDGRFFAVFLPVDTRGRIMKHTLRIRVFAAEGTQKAKAPLVFLPGTGTAFVPSTHTRKAIAKNPSLKLLGVNHRGGNDAGLCLVGQDREPL